MSGLFGKIKNHDHSPTSAVSPSVTTQSTISSKISMQPMEIADLCEDFLHLIFREVPPINRLPLTEVCRSWSGLMERFKVRIASRHELLEVVKRGDLYSLVKSPYSAGISDNKTIKWAMAHYNKGVTGAYNWLKNKYLDPGNYPRDEEFHIQFVKNVCRYGTDEMIDWGFRRYISINEEYECETNEVALNIARRNKHHIVRSIGADYIEWLADTGQYELIGAGISGDLDRYINLSKLSLNGECVACKYGHMNIIQYISNFGSIVSRPSYQCRYNEFLGC